MTVLLFLMYVQIVFSSVLGCGVATFRERAVHLVYPMFSLYKFLFVILGFSHFGFEGRIWILVVPVPGHCLLVTFKSLSHTFTVLAPVELRFIPN